MRTRRVQALVLVFLVGFYCQCVRLYRTVPWEDRFIYTTHDPQEVNYTDDVTTTMPNSYSRGATINVISTPEANETCPYSSPLLHGPIYLNRSETTVLEQENTIPKLFPVKHGGAGCPANCTTRHRVAIIVPYRDREQQLGIFIRHIHPILIRQLVDYRVFLIQQTKESWFNKGVLFNAGTIEIERQFPGYFNCLILQDVDILTEDDNILYRCAEGRATHLSTYVDRYKYLTAKAVTVGGILAIPTQLFKEVNGFSNAFYGWGGEDDDFLVRLNQKKVVMDTLPDWARAGSLEHGGREKRNNRLTLLRSSEARQILDGLNTVYYTMVDYKEQPLYTNITIRVNIRYVKNYLAKIGFSI